MKRPALKRIKELTEQQRQEEAEGLREKLDSKSFEMRRIARLVEAIIDYLDEKGL